MLILTVCLFQPVRKAQESQKEMKLLLDMYKSAPKEQRDKVQLMAAERKSKAEVCSSAIHPPSVPHSEWTSLMKQSTRKTKPAHTSRLSLRINVSQPQT